MKKFYTLFALVLVLSFGLAACGGGGGGDGTLLGEVKARDYLIVSTDPNYEPISYLDPDAERASGTICPEDLLTYGEMVGFDVDVAKAVADELGLEVCFATPDWDLVTAGSWGDRWQLG